MNFSSPRRWRCSKGHEWEATENEICSFKLNDSLPICGQCLKEFLEQNFGVVEEITADQPVMSTIPIYGDSVQEDGA